MEKFNECADYDSMGNCGRFPKTTKKIKNSLLERFILFCKNLV